MYCKLHFDSQLHPSPASWGLLHLMHEVSL